jgi:hypothetical protein
VFAIPPVAIATTAGTGLVPLAVVVIGVLAAAIAAARASSP